jgi:hypothetical protein
MCLNQREAGELVAAAAQTGLVLQVGYMRRYAEAFVRASRLGPGCRRSDRDLAMTPPRQLRTTGFSNSSCDNRV